jgi:hypothetical protein
MSQIDVSPTERAPGRDGRATTERAPGRDRRASRLRALRLVVFAALLEIMLVAPFVDHLADSNPTVHFTQHGLIFAGGVLMGLALRDVQRGSRS